MRNTLSHCTRQMWATAVLLGLLAAGCDGRDPILGIGALGVLAPIVTAVTPVNGATGVATYNTGITATFNEPMTALVSGTSFTVTCAAPCMNPTGTVALDATNTVATFTLTPSTGLAPLTTYTATIAGATGLVSGVALATPYVWKFKTGAAPPAPTVTAVDPANNAVGVALNDSISATFSEAMAPITGAASFTVTCAPHCVDPTGTIALDATHTVATFTLAAGKVLTAGTLYTATITAATSFTTGVALANPYVWHFMTGIATNTTRPRVLLTEPATTAPGPTLGVPTNSALTAAFSEEMAPATINGGSFIVTCAAPCVSPNGAVTYDSGSNTAVFTPAVPLTAGATYTATITMGATDLAGNALAGNQAPLPAASNYVWTFKTVAAGPPSHVTVASTNPDDGATGVCPNASVNATFMVPNGLRMDPSTITMTTFIVTGPAPAVTSVDASSVTLDAATGTIATFIPQTALAVGTYTAAIMGGATGVKDLAVPADDMVADHTWNFTVGAATGNCLAPVPLGAAAPFADFGGSAGMTNTGTLTVINGDTGTIATATSSITGFHDTAGDVYTETPANKGAVNGTIYTCTNSTTGPTANGPNAANCLVAGQALLAAQKAYLALVAMPAGANPGANLANQVLTPGVYTAPAPGSFMIEGGDLTLDAQGNANAVFVFQMSTTLTIGGPGATAPQNVILVGGAQAKNVFWQVGSAATINAAGGGIVVGTIITKAGLVFSTVGNVSVLTLNGRALSLGASVTLVDTVINVPGP
jgi:hypothetical protein